MYCRRIICISRFNQRKNMIEIITNPVIITALTGGSLLIIALVIAEIQDNKKRPKVDE